MCCHRMFKSVILNEDVFCRNEESNSKRYFSRSKTNFFDMTKMLSYRIQRFVDEKSVPKDVSVVKTKLLRNVNYLFYIINLSKLPRFLLTHNFEY